MILPEGVMGALVAYIARVGVAGLERMWFVVAAWKVGLDARHVADDCNTFDLASEIRPVPFAPESRHPIRYRE